MKKIILSAAIILAAISCKKKNTDPTPSESQALETSSKTQSDDNKNLNDGIDNALNSVKNGFGGAGARMDVAYNCGVAIDYSQFSSSKKITYTFDGSCNDNGAFKTGKIIVKLIQGAKFEDQGAKYTADFEAFTSKINNKIISIGGSLTATNVTGGNGWLTIFGWPGAKATVVEKVKGTAVGSIDGSAATTLQFSRTTTFSRVDTTWSISIAGDTAVGNYNKLYDWGTNRYGEVYYKEMTEPFTISSKCGGFAAFLRPSGGKCKISVIRPNNTPYYISWRWLLNTSGCANGYELSVFDDKNNKWDFTVNY